MVIKDKLNLTPAVVTNSAGGKQSQLFQYDQTLLEILPLLRQILERGSAKYDETPYEANWQLIPATDHVEHALAHLMRWYQYETVGKGHEDIESDEPDLTHAIVRCIFALYQTMHQDK